MSECNDCLRKDDTDGEWFAWSHQYQAFLCYQCFQKRPRA